MNQAAMVNSVTITLVVKKSVLGYTFSNQLRRHFTLVDGKKVYPEQQNAGDFIVFPSWALHQVDINDTFDDRVVIIAGNILWDTLNTVKEGKVTKQTKCFSVSDTLCLWESKYV